MNSTIIMKSHLFLAISKVNCYPFFILFQPMIQVWDYNFVTRILHDFLLLYHLIFCLLAQKLYIFQSGDSSQLNRFLNLSNMPMVFMPKSLRNIAFPMA